MQLCFPSTAPTQLMKIGMFIKTFCYWSSFFFIMCRYASVANYFPNCHTGSLYNFTCSRSSNPIIVMQIFQAASSSKIPETKFLKIGVSTNFFKFLIMCEQISTRTRHWSMLRYWLLVFSLESKLENKLVVSLRCRLGIARDTKVSIKKNF
jgi:hypothetical protein